MLKSRRGNPAELHAVSGAKPRHRYYPGMSPKPIDPASLPPWKRKPPPGNKTRSLSAQQLEAARMRAAQAGRRYPNLVDNMWAARNVPRGETLVSLGEDE